MQRILQIATQDAPVCCSNSEPVSVIAVTHTDLWDRAYDELKMRNPRLVAAYENIISKSEGISSSKRFFIHYFSSTRAACSPYHLER
jgi:hypothetical protein